MKNPLEHLRAMSEKRKAHIQKAANIAEGIKKATEAVQKVSREVQETKE